MNAALTETLIKLIPHSISAGYAKILLNDPNRAFGITLQYFYMMLGNNDPHEKEASRIAMSAKWDGYNLSILREHVEDGCAYAAFADVPLTNTQAMDTLVAVILRTGLYAAAYELWLALPADTHITITQALDWWAMKCCIKKNATKVLGRQAAGMYGANTAQ